MIKVGQIGLKLHHVVQKERYWLITSQVERFNVKLNISHKVGMPLIPHLLLEES